MKLRSKILLVVLAVLAINYLLLTAVLLLIQTRRLVAEEERVRMQVSAIITPFLESMPADPALKAATNTSIVSAAERLQNAGILGQRWRIRRGDGDILTASYSALERSGSPFHYSLPVVTGDGRRYSVDVDYPEGLHDFSLLEGMDTMLAVMLVGMALLAMVLYLMVSRQVLDPVERLLRATRSLDDGRPRPLSFPTSRNDEIGQLMRAFDKMVHEVNETRENLEQRVAEARVEIEHTQRSLALQERLAATGRLAAGLAHEINNPLGGILNALVRLRKDDLPSEKKEEYLRLAEEGINRMGDIVRRVLEFSRNDPVSGPLDLLVPLKRAFGFCRHRCENEDVTVTMELPETLPPVKADCGEMQQVFLNILQNALDAMSDSENNSSLCFLTSVTEEDVSVTITDTGCGMTDVEKNACFDLFHTTKPVGKGTGLGLSIAHRIVTRCGGDISITSTIGQGTSIAITLPLIQEDEEE